MNHCIANLDIGRRSCIYLPKQTPLHHPAGVHQLPQWCLFCWISRAIKYHKLYIFITLTSQWPRWRLKSPASRLFTQTFIQTQIKENIKAPRHWHLCGEFTGTGEFPAQRASNAENVSIWWRHHVAWYCQNQHFSEQSFATQHDGGIIPWISLEGAAWKYCKLVELKN